LRQENDYILRLIEQLGAMIRTALGKLGVKDPEERPEVAGEAIGLALSMDPVMASNLAPQSLAALLRLAEVDARVLALLQQALEIEATAFEDHGDLTTAMLRRDQAKAVRYLLEARTHVAAGGAPGGADVSYTA
jgi:hypothetical protein